MLDIPECNLGDDNFIFFIKPISFKQEPSLNNKLQNFELRELEIEIQRNEINDLNPLREAFCNCRELRRFCLDASYSSVWEISKLADSFKNLKKLEELYLNLYRTHVEDPQIITLLESLKTLPKLKRVELDFGKTYSYYWFDELYEIVKFLKKKIPEFYCVLALPIFDADDEPLEKFI